MPSINDIYRVIVSITYLGQECRLIDFRRIVSLPPNPLTDPELANSYGSKFATEIMPILSSQATLTGVEVENLTDGLSFGTWGFTTNGGSAGEGMPSYVALSVQLKRSSKLTRNGAKRIPGVPEAAVQNNQHNLSAGNKDKIEFFFGGQTLFDDITVPTDTFNLEPVIVGRTADVNGNYQLDLAKINPVSTAQLRPNVTTQNTRKSLD